ncbi:MAG: SusC/RagA family TonB-linked outer membrane protein [Bacteroidaceae bacterium]|nr:SusC/RagA family TonB-linked outer membrane protein [Bacteroidaceae bacterium]
MRIIFCNPSLEKAIRTGLCLCLLAGWSITPAMAQDDVEEADVEEAPRRIVHKKPAKQYPTQSVAGVITDAATGAPMGGVRVQALQLPQYSTLTEEDGSYKLDVPTFCHALVIDAPDYNVQQLAIKGSTGQDAKMLSNKFQSYYTDGTSITSQRTVHLDETSSLSVETDMQRLLEGDIRSINRSALPAQGSYFTIRGVNSINANAQPLFIIDGNIVDLELERTSLHEGYYNNLLSGLDPENIESVQVLKNATALYGAKGANGVVIITTKRGHSQATKINVRIYGGVELAPNKLKMMGESAYRRYLGDLTSSIQDLRDNGTSGLDQMAFLSDNPQNFYSRVYSGNNTDWQKDMYRTAFTQNYKVSVEGGDDIGMYALSLGYTNGKSTLKGNDFSRLNLRFNTDIKMFEKVTAGLDIAYNQTSYDVLDNGWSENYEMQNIGSTNVLGLVQAPFISPYAYYYDENTRRLELSDDYAGKYASTNLAGRWVQNPFVFPRALGINESLRNPYWVIENGKGKNKNYAELTQININFSPKYQVTKQLAISDRFNYTMNRNNEKYFLPIAGTTPYQLTDLGTITSVLKTQFTKETTINNDLRIAWGNTYGAHTINAFAGWRYNNYSYSYTYMRGYNNENDKLPNISKNMQYVNYGGTKDNWIDMAYYINADYNFMNRYFAQFTASAQSSSRFGKDTKGGLKLAGVSWGIFPSLQLGWIISSEPWFKTGRGVQYLKLTAGVDQSGNDGIDYYAARTYWASQQYSRNTVGLVLDNIENTGIQWETTTRWNIALEGSFLNNRLTAGIDLFWAKTDNLLTMKDLDYVAGVKRYWTNDGQLKNRGFEIHANAALINQKDWKWEVGATVGHYNNKITKLPDTNVITLKDVDGNVTRTIAGYTNSIFGKDNVLTAVGYAAGSFFGWETKGVYANDAEASTATNVARNGNTYMKYPTGMKDDPYRNFQAGDVRFVDQNNDGVIDDADRVVIGNPNPDIYGNIFTGLSWKNLRLDANFKYSLGNDVYNYQRSILEGGNTTYNQTTAMQNRWTYEGQRTDIPKACYMDSEDWRNNERMSDRWIEDGSFLKLKNVRLTYTFPVKSDWLMGLRVWGEANNLFTVTKYHGIDPETSCRNSALYQGIDTGLLSLGRNFNLGVTINL